jgi:hypothetical protein
MASQAALSTSDEEQGKQGNALWMHLLWLKCQNALIEKHLNDLSVGFSRNTTVTPDGKGNASVNWNHFSF